MAPVRYRIRGRIASGGMGIVYRAEDLILRRPVVLKFLSPDASQDGPHGTLLLREARAAAAVSHPNICTIYEVGEVPTTGGMTPPESESSYPPGTPFIAMELIDGRTLDHVIKEEALLSFERIVRIAIQIAEGMAAAHARGIIHRDLKSANIIVTPDDHVKILDFGLARPLHLPEARGEDATSAGAVSAAIDATGKVYGTLAYMAPERLLGQRATPRSDIFSFGVILYEMVSGQAPFTGETTLEVIAKILEARPRPPAHARPDLPATLERIMNHCLQRAPEDRPRSAQELITNLRDLQSRLSQDEARRSGQRQSQEATTTVWQPVQAPTATPPRQGVFRSRRRLVLAGALGTLLLLIVAAVLKLRPVEETHAPPPTYRQLTTSGQVLLAAISPDGQSFAYVDGPRDGPQKVIVSDIDGAGALPIFEGATIGGIAWSPARPEILVRCEAGPSGAPEVYIVPRLGGSAFRLDHPELKTVCWSPDGSRIAAAMGKGEIRLIDVAGDRVTVVRPPSDSSWVRCLDWSPSGEYLLFSMDTGTRPIRTLAISGGREFLVREPGQYYAHWSPRGDAILCLDGRSNTPILGNLITIPIDPRTGRRAGEPTVILPALKAADFSISRSGSRLVFVSSEIVARNLILLERSQEGPNVKSRETALSGGTAHHAYPRFSPDGHSVAFIHIDDKRRAVLVRQLPQGAEGELPFRHSVGAIAWSPRGDALAFTDTTDPNKKRIGTVSIAGGSPRYIEATDVGVQVLWLAQDRLLYQTEDAADCRIVDIVTQREVPLLPPGSEGRIWQVRASPDGRWVAAARNVTRSEGITVWLLPTSGEGARLLYKDRAAPVGWSADGRWVFLVRPAPPEAARDGAILEVVRVSVDGRRIEPIFRIPFYSAWTHIDVSSDGKRLICPREEGSSDAWLVDNLDLESKR